MRSEYRPPTPGAGGGGVWKAVAGTWGRGNVVAWAWRDAKKTANQYKRRCPPAPFHLESLGSARMFPSCVSCCFS